MTGVLGRVPFSLLRENLERVVATRKDRPLLTASEGQAGMVTDLAENRTSRLRSSY
jgi:hypothetical protein